VLLWNGEEKSMNITREKLREIVSPTCEYRGGFLALIDAEKREEISLEEIITRWKEICEKAGVEHDHGLHLDWLLCHTLSTSEYRNYLGADFFVSNESCSSHASRLFHTDEMLPLLRRIGVI
jgi:hypothetical protein